MSNNHTSTLSASRELAGRQCLLSGHLWGSQGIFAQAAASAVSTHSGGVGSSSEEMIDTPYGRAPSYIREIPYIKIIAAVARKPNLTPEQFQSYWLSVHGPLVRTFQSALKIMRYVQAHVIDSPVITSIAMSHNWTANPFDSVVELWWRSEEELAAVLASPEGQQAGAIIAEDERKFCDSRGIAFMVREYEVCRHQEYQF